MFPIQSGQEEVWEPLLASCQGKEGGLCHCRPTFFLPGSSDPSHPAWAAWIQPPTPVTSTSSTLPPLHNMHSFHCDELDTLSTTSKITLVLLQRLETVTTWCCGNTIKPEQCRSSRLWGELVPEDAMFVGHVGIYSQANPITYPWPHHLVPGTG